MTALAIDLGGSHAACALVGKSGIVASRSIAADGNAPLADLPPALSKTLHELLHSAPADAAAPSALVLGFCGIVGARKGRVLATNGKFEDAAELDLKDWRREEFGLPFLIENDARLALLGEYTFGATRDAQDVVMITLGSGVGGAALLGGQLLQSKHGLACAIGGHIPVVLDGRLCSCGNLGCTDAEASTAVLGDVYRTRRAARPAHRATTQRYSEPFH